MQEWLVPYVPTIWALGMSGALLLTQLLVVDVAGIQARHRPGTPVEVDYSSFLFRATRAHANTNESIAAFVLLALFGTLSVASPGWLNALSWIYVVARLAHMACYYAGAQLARSVAFGAGLAALFGMLILGGKWSLSEFHPMGDVPTGVKLTSYSGESSDITCAQLQRYVSLVESGELTLKLGPSFGFEMLRDAHIMMDENRANGKIVIEVI